MRTPVLQERSGHGRGASSGAGWDGLVPGRAGESQGAALLSGGMLPARLGFLLDPARYKIIHGGRGAGKSWSVARALLLLGAEKPLRILCAREFQNSLTESVHRLLAEQVEQLQLSDIYTVRKAAITGANGTSFVFVGLRHNISKIKSFEGADIVWVEEGQTV